MRFDVLVNLLLVFGILMTINGVILFKQALATSKIYSELRKKGRLIFGNRRSLLVLVTYVVAFAVDKNEKVVEAVKISGIMPFQNVKTETLPYKGQSIKRMKVVNEKVDYDTQRTVAAMLKKHNY